MNCASDHLIPLARDHLIPLAWNRLSPRLSKIADMIRGFPKNVADMKDALEKIEVMAETKEDKQLREAVFCLEDFIDEYIIREGQLPCDSGCAALPCETVDFVKSIILRLQIAYMIPDINSQLRANNGGSENGGFKIRRSIMEQKSGDFIAHLKAISENLQTAHLYHPEEEVVGFENPKNELIGWLTEERADLTVIPVVGMGGQGKSTLAKQIFDNVINHFNCHAWIPVSRSSNVEDLLRKMLELWKIKSEDLPHDISTMDHQSPKIVVRNHLQGKRYVIFFDGVWNELLWEQLKLALIDNRNGSRILFTTRNMKVVNSCKSHFLVHVHKLQPLTQEKSLELFYKKAFIQLNGRCPENLMNISSEIVEKCEGLPLAIVAIGGYLSVNDGNAVQWQEFAQNLSLEWDNYPHLTAIKMILDSSFHDLDYNLKRCFLYFGIYPDNYEVKTERLIRQWIAEGFVKDKQRKTLEEVAEDYLDELINRNLVQVSSFGSDGKTKSCRVSYLVKQTILDKIKDVCFCHFTSENEDQSVPFSGMIRRLTIATGSNNLMESDETSNIRSLHIFRNDELPDSFLKSIPSKHRLLKVLDFEDFPLYHYVPENLGDLFHLRYLSFRNTKVTNLPESIGMLHNLETLDLRQTMVREMPREINQLKKLLHLLTYNKSKGVRYGIRMKDGIGNIASLQTLSEVEADHGGVELVEELQRLTRLRMLGLTNVKREHTSALCSSIKAMKDLKKLYIASIDEYGITDLHFNVPVPFSINLRLTGKLAHFPCWVRDLPNLVKLSLSHSMLTKIDQLESLEDLPNLSCLSILDDAYRGECLHFPDGGLQKLKQLVLRCLDKLNSILIGRGALCSLEKFKLVNIPQLKEMPSGVYNLPKLKVFHIKDMPAEFEQSIDCHRGQTWTLKKDAQLRN